MDREKPACECAVSSAMAPRVGQGRSAGSAVAGSGLAAKAEREAVLRVHGGRMGLLAFRPSILNEGIRSSWILPPDGPRNWRGNRKSDSHHGKFPQ